MRKLHALLALLILSVTIFAGCDDGEHASVLDGLVAQRADQREVEKRLGPGFTEYRKETRSWTDLEQFLAREPQNDLVPLRKAIETYPLILYYTTAWRMTWLFFDDHGILKEYYLTTQ